MEIRTLPADDALFEIGMISRTHGKNGEVLISLKENDYDFSHLQFFFFKLQERMVPFFISSIQEKANSLIVKFEDIKTMEKAEQYSGTKLFVEKNDSDEEDDDYDIDLEGFTIVDAQSHDTIGVVTEVLQYSANIVLDVHRTTGSSVLLPFAEELVESVDDEQHKIILTISDGLLDVEA